MAGSSVNKCWANKLCLQMNEVHAPWLRCQGVRAPSVTSHRSARLCPPSRVRACVPPPSCILGFSSPED